MTPPSPGSRSIPCPACGGGQSRCTQKRLSKSGVPIRYRLCSCGHRFTTHEVLAEQQTRRGQPKKAIYHRKDHDQLVQTPQGLRWTYTHEDVEVEVMARHRNYLMVRRTGCMPFVVTRKQVTFP